MTPLWWPVITAALVSALVSLVVLWWNSKQARLDRQRELFGQGFAAVVAYQEFAYIVRRRDGSDETRTAISRDLSKVQAELHRYEAMIRVEAPKVADEFSELILQTRALAGAAIKEGWCMPPAQSDQRMHVPSVDLSRLDAYEEGYLRAVHRHLYLRARIKQWLRRLNRTVR